MRPLNIPLAATSRPKPPFVGFPQRPADWSPASFSALQSWPGSFSQVTSPSADPLGLLVPLGPSPTVTLGLPLPPHPFPHHFFPATLASVTFLPLEHVVCCSGVPGADFTSFGSTQRQTSKPSMSIPLASQRPRPFKPRSLLYSLSFAYISLGICFAGCCPHWNRNSKDEGPVTMGPTRMLSE